MKTHLMQGDYYKAISKLLIRNLEGEEEDKDKDAEKQQ